jgi:hypothetical protein
MAGDLMLLATFFVEPHAAAATLNEVVANLHFEDGGDPREGVNHDADQRPVAQADERPGRAGVEQRPRFFRREDPRLAFVDDVFRAAHGLRRIDVEDVTCHQPVEQHAQRREMLLDRRRGEFALQLFDERRHLDRLHVGELCQPEAVSPGGEAPGGIQIQRRGQQLRSRRKGQRGVSCPRLRPDPARSPRRSGCRRLFRPANEQMPVMEPEQDMDGFGVRNGVMLADDAEGPGQHVGAPVEGDDGVGYFGFGFVHGMG